MTESELDKNEDESVEQALWPSPGQKLKSIREELGYSEAKVAEFLHMTVRYIRALENDEYHILPGKIFVKGYYKAYANFLNVDVDEILRCYEQYSAAVEETEVTEAKVILARKNYDQNKRWSICAAVIIVLIIAVSWWLQ